VQDYGLAIREGTYDTVKPLLHMLFIAFAMLQNKYYLDAVGLYLLLLEYQASNGHPHIKLLKTNFSNFVGEDIELANRALSFATKHVRGRSDVETLDRSYRQLGCMLPISALMLLMLTEVRSLRGWGSSKRLVHTRDEEIVQIGVNYMQTLLASFRDGSFKHYHLPVPGESKKRGRPTGATALPKGSKPTKPPNSAVSLKNVKTARLELLKAECVDVL